MRYDNPAARLADILEEGLKADGNTNARSVWMAILKPEDKDDHRLIALLGKVQGLTRETIEALDREHPDLGPIWTPWANQIASAFFQMGLRDKWEKFKSQIDANTLHGLRAAAKILDSSSPRSVISTDALAQLKAELDELYVDVLGADVPEEVKKYVLFHLRRLRTAVDEYRLTGGMPIMDAVYAAGGSAYNSGMGAKVAESGLADKFWDIVQKAGHLGAAAQGVVITRQFTQFLIGQMN